MQYSNRKFALKRAFASMLLLLVFIQAANLAAAHEIRPSIADFNLRDGGQFDISIQTNIEALLTGIGSAHSDTDEAANADVYNAYRALEPEELDARFEGFSEQFLKELIVRFDGVQATSLTVTTEIPEVGDLDLARESVIRIAGALPAGAKTFSWGWPEAYGASVIRVNISDDDSIEGYSAYLAAGEVSEDISIQRVETRSFGEVAWEYLVIGFTHIIPKGLDHILFVVGLFLLSTKLSALLWQITAFTVAHTVTLALGILGHVNVSPGIVEPLIAASIVYVAVENIMTGTLHRWRPVVVFLFGLLHGLGFAGVLTEIGLSPSYFVTGLIAFNVGVELGQLAVIGMCFALVGYWFGDKPWYRKVITIPLSLIIALIALWWVYERVFLG